MNKFLKFIMVMASLLAVFAVQSLQAQVYNQNLITFTNLPATVAATSASATTNTLTLWQNSGLALSGRFNVATNGNGGAASVGYLVWFSVDGTNYPAAPLAVLGAAATNTIVQIQTNLPASYLAGFSSMQIQITNANAGTMTNFGVILNRWRAPQPY